MCIFFSVSQTRRVTNQAPSFGLLVFTAFSTYNKCAACAVDCARSRARGAVTQAATALGIVTLGLLDSFDLDLMWSQIQDVFFLTV